jgi:hypothetical protein
LKIGGHGKAHIAKANKSDCGHLCSFSARSASDGFQPHAASIWVCSGLLWQNSKTNGGEMQAKL